jgi:DNA-binding XRE family transcriptional regulator
VDDPPKYTPSPLGLLIASHREKAGMTRRELAKRIGITFVGLHDVERGKRSTLRMDYWGAIIEALPSISLENIRHATLMSVPYTFTPGDFKGRRCHLVYSAIRLIQSCHGMTDEEVENAITKLEKMCPPSNP